jgi:hypothetical protein
LPTTRLALSRMISQIADMMNQDIDCNTFTFWTIFDLSIAELRSELADFYPKATASISETELSTGTTQNAMTDSASQELRNSQVQGPGDSVREESLEHKSQCASRSMHDSVDEDSDFDRFCYERQSNASSCSTAQWSVSMFSHASLGSRRGRRRPAPRSAIPLTNPAPGTEQGFYSCTFCPKRFNRKYIWQRHEESVHVLRKVYICTPEFLLDPPIGHPAGSPWCSWCPWYPFLGTKLLRPDCDHAGGQCSTRTIEERTFFRKDNLVQHFRIVHKASAHSYSVQNAANCEQARASTATQLKCPFCGCTSTSWKERVGHVARHFEESLKDWMMGYISTK